MNGNDGIQRGAALSSCGIYRFALWRKWGEGANVTFIMLNPSTADAKVDDATIRRCIGYARAWGYSGISVVNLFAFRATEPADMMKAALPVGYDNDVYLLAAAKASYIHGAPVVCAWGVQGRYRDRDRLVMRQLQEVGIEAECLAVSKDGFPKHPLYLKRDLKPIAYRGRP